MAGVAFAVGGPVTVIPAAILSAAGSSGNMLEFIVSLGAKGFGFGAAKATLRGFNLDQAAKQAASRTGVTLKNIDQHQIYRASVVVFEQMLSKFYEEMFQWFAGSATEIVKSENDKR